MKIVTASDMKNRFGKYLKIVREGGEIYIEKNGKIIAKIIPVKEPLPEDEVKERI